VQRFEDAGVRFSRGGRTGGEVAVEEAGYVVSRVCECCREFDCGELEEEGYGSVPGVEDRGPFRLRD